jgi:hypothetical protein
MTTIKVSIKNKRDAGLLVSLLKRMSFVEKVEEVGEARPKANQFDKLRVFLTSNSSSSYFGQITDPVSWQKSLRHEWK